MASGRSVSSRRCGGAFSLIELLSVMSVLCLLAVATVPALRGTLDGINVSGAASIMEGDMSLARQTAMSRNLPVEVRLYRHDDGGGEAWRVIALVIPATSSGQASDEWLTRGKLLPGNIVMADTASFSTILANAGPVAPPQTPVAPWSAQESSTAPPLLKGKSYVGFLFQPDGSTDLPPDSPWCLTLKNKNSQPGSDGMPANHFVSLVIDSATGRTLSYQP